MDGFYIAYFTGLHGSGYAVLVLREGIIAGADATGAILDGKYELNKDNSAYDAAVTLRPQRGTLLVTGHQITEDNATVPIPMRLPLGFENGEVVQVETPTGPINLSFRKIRGLT